MFYNLALARIGGVDSVALPWVDDRGDINIVDLIIGRHSQIEAVSSPDSTGELVEVGLILGIYDRAYALRLPRGEEFSDDERGQMQWPEHK